jgi:hypothetical protein
MTTCGNGDGAIENARQTCYFTLSPTTGRRFGTSLAGPPLGGALRKR